jgi:TonB family protein
MRIGLTIHARWRVCFSFSLFVAFAISPALAENDANSMQSDSQRAHLLMQNVIEKLRTNDRVGAEKSCEEALEMIATGKQPVDAVHAKEQLLNEYGFHTAATRLSAGAWYLKTKTPIALYVADIRAQHKRNWRCPPGHELKVVYVVFTINKNGALSEVHIDRSSGVPSVDRAAIDAVNQIRMGPLPIAEKAITIQHAFAPLLDRSRDVKLVEPAHVHESTRP